MRRTTELSEEEKKKKVERRIYFICMKRLFGVVIIVSIITGIVARTLYISPQITYIIVTIINVILAWHYYKDYERMKKDPALASKLFVYDMMSGGKISHKDFPESKNNLENNKNN